MSSDKLAQALREAVEVLNWYADGKHRVILSGRMDWPSQRAKLAADGFDFDGEAGNGDEYFVERGTKAEAAADAARQALAAYEAEKQAGPVARAHVRSVTPGRIDELDVLRPLPQGTHLLYAAPVQASAVGAEPVRYPHPDEDDPVTLWKEIRRLRAAMSQAGPVAWLNYPCITDADGNFVKHGEPELGFRRLAYGYDADKAVPLYAAPPSPQTEQDKDDAERYQCLKEMASGGPNEGSYFFPGIDAWGGDVPMDPLSVDQAVDAIRAARAKKEQQ